MIELAIAARIPLVRRNKPPGLSLEARIAELTALTVEPPGADHHQLVARASGVLNFAALIASDTGLPDLAADLCWRQHEIFTESDDLPADVAVMSLMPLVNIARLLIREGDGDAAYDTLHRLYRAAQQRGSAVIGEHEIDMASLIRDDETHRVICTELWTTLLIDGARALARSGRWTEAANAISTHRGVGNRLLDGRQIKIMSFVEQNLHEEAVRTIDASTLTDPWESTVANLLRIYCRPDRSKMALDELDRMVQAAKTLVNDPNPMTASFRVRAGLTALDLAANQHVPSAIDLCGAIIEVATADAYAARDVLDSEQRPQLTVDSVRKLTAVVSAAGLGQRFLKPGQLDALTKVVALADRRLRALIDKTSRSKARGG
ncbi:hypothetical protein SAMN05421505_10452 [Sinosporangium album]|uniref:Uncharacterized protein n=1 Tax=Sinosporangium album TaxID=504805 RepID=A0A1G7U1F4_9ACTN|nr:hypothetical protein [Sinosporangium album]SDG41366.1 hypothetical protein SAMN05421505_10452 [Sinosporangium album]